MDRQVWQTHQLSIDALGGNPIRLITFQDMIGEIYDDFGTTAGIDRGLAYVVDAPRSPYRHPSKGTYSRAVGAARRDKADGSSGLRQIFQCIADGFFWRFIIDDGSTG